MSKKSLSCNNFYNKVFQEDNSSIENSLKVHEIFVHCTCNDLGKLNYGVRWEINTPSLSFYPKIIQIFKEQQISHKLNILKKFKENYKQENDTKEKLCTAYVSNIEDDIITIAYNNPKVNRKIYAEIKKTNFTFNPKKGDFVDIIKITKKNNELFLSYEKHDSPEYRERLQQLIKDIKEDLKTEENV